MKYMLLIYADERAWTASETVSEGETENRALIGAWTNPNHKETRKCDS
jgi:hypothetical protein